jgi:chemotaxis protein methyltransferase CheR/type IV pilus assembly protein PilK
VTELGGQALEIDDRQFSDWRAVLEKRLGLYIAPERRSFLASGLRARMRETGYDSYGQYYRYMVSRHRHEEEWALLADCLTVHETCFFRHRSSMKLVSEVILPQACKDGGRFSAWSVGCATGEETYSLAMLADFHCAAVSGTSTYRVCGTDISTSSLRHARAGIYLNRRLSDVSDSFRSRYCYPVSKARFAVHARLRENAEFIALNLRDVEQAPFSNLDLVFCQNLLIYYDRPRRLELVERLSRFLRPGGVLVLGPGEVLNWQNPDMEKVRCDDTLAYRRSE